MMTIVFVSSLVILFIVTFTEVVREDGGFNVQLRGFLAMGGGIIR